MHALDVLRPHTDKSLDRVTALASTLTSRPTALITFLSPDGQWVGSRYGWDQPFHPLSESFCIHTVLDDRFLEVPDASTDERFRQNALVSGHQAVRFYAGYPLKVAGYALGALCVLDQKPGHLAQPEAQGLERLADLVCDILKLRLERSRAEDGRAKAEALVGAMKHQR